MKPETANEGGGGSEKSRSSVNRFILFLVVFLFSVSLFVGVASAYNLPTESEVFFSENADTNFVNWSVYDSPTVSTSIKYDGSSSFNLSDGRSITKKFNTLDLVSPIKELSFRIYLTNVSTNEFITLFIMGEGTESANMTDDLLKMTWNGTHVQFTVKSYSEASPIETNTSDYILLSSDAWHVINITTNTTLTKIAIDGIPVQFDGKNYSSILTNPWNVLKFGDRNWLYQTRNAYTSNQATPSNEIKDDDGGFEDFYTVSSYTAKKNLTMPSAILNNISVAYVKINVDKESTGSFTVNVNGNNYAVPIEDGMVGGYHWVLYEINKSDLVSGNNTITVRGSSGYLKLDKTNDFNRSWWNNNDVAGEWGVRIAYSPFSGFYLDDIIVKQNPIINSSDIDDKVNNTFTFLENAVTPNDLSAIYAYQATGNTTYLEWAEIGADDLQSNYISGKKNCVDASGANLKDLAVLCQYNSSRIALLGNLADQFWEYHVNHSTNLVIYGIYENGSIYDMESPLTSNVNSANAYLIAYGITSNTTYLERGEKILNAYYNYRSAQGLPRWSLYSNGSVLYSYLKVGDGAANFIQTALLFYEITGNSTYLNMSRDIANAYIQYGWSGDEAFYYTVTGSTPQTIYEMYTPMMDFALLKLYELTGNETYKNISIIDYDYMVVHNKENGLRTHAFDRYGRRYHSPSYFMGDDAKTSTLLYKHTANSTYLDNMYKYELQQIKATDWQGLTLDAQTYSSSGSNLLAYPLYLLYSFIRPTSNVTVNTAFGADCYGAYIALANIFNNLRFYQDQKKIFIRDIESNFSTGNLIVDDYFNTEIVLGSNSTFNLSLISGVGNYTIPFQDWYLYKITNSGVTKVIYVNSTIRLGTDGRILDYSGIPYDVVPMFVATSSELSLTVSNWSSTYRQWNESSANSSTIVNHTICDLTSGDFYVLRRDDSYFATKQANSSGCIEFNNSVWSSHVFTLEQDSTKPTIWNVSLSSMVLLGNTSLSISADVSDNANVSVVWAQVDKPDGLENVTLNLTGGLHAGTFASTSYQGVYNVTVYANDTSRNVNSSNVSFTVASCLVSSDCGSDGYVGSNFCGVNDVYRSNRSFVCASPGTASASCGYVDTPVLQDDCGDSAVVEGENYCSGNNISKDLVTVIRGCDTSTSSCFVRSSQSTATVEVCGVGFVCSGGACYVNGTQPTTTSSSTSSTVSTTSTTTTRFCPVAGDYPPCGEVALSEVWDYINLWAMGEAALSDVVKLINAWASG